MKIFKDSNIRKKIIRIAVCTVVCIIIRLNNHFAGFTENDSLIRFLIGVELLLEGVIIWTLFWLIKNTDKPFLKNGKRFLSKKIKLILDKIRKKANLKRKYVKGTDENSYVWNFNLGIKNKLKNKPRQKLNIKCGSSNTEKIRLLYVKLILILTEKNYEIRQSYTPKEIKDKINYRESDILFDVYEKIRYGNNNNVAISDDIIKSCENAADELK